MDNKKMTVFISWSQSTSHKIAEILKEELEPVFNEEIEFWVSSQDIVSGDIAINSINAALQRSDMAIVCLDSSNFRQPWIYYETGMVFGRNYDINKENSSIICPIIFDNLKIGSFSRTPFYNMQMRAFNKTNMLRIIRDINRTHKEKYKVSGVADKTIRIIFDNIWPQLYDRISSIIKQEGDEASMLTESNVPEKLTKYQEFPAPTYGDVLHYSSGFETQAFYRFLLENVTNRLYIFGRKNRKLSERSLETKYAKLLSKNVDVKILFLNPNSTSALDNSAQDVSDFRVRLITSIKDYIDRYKRLNVKIEEHCRMYTEQRESEIIIADNVVFYRDIAFCSDGKPIHFTNQSFNISSINSQLGTEYYKQFSTVWEANEQNKITENCISSF